MGLIALLFSVVVDAIWPLRGRARGGRFGDEDDDAPEADFVDPFDEPPFDHLADAAAGLSPDPAAGLAGLAGSPPEPSARPSNGGPAWRPPPGSAAAAAAAASSEAASEASDAGYPVHPLRRHALGLIDWMSSDEVDSKGIPRRYLAAPGWIVVVGVPVVLAALAQALLGALGGFFVFVLHVGVLYLTVGLGSFYRRFMALQLLIGAGEERSARLVLARWIGAAVPLAEPARGTGAGGAGATSLSTLARQATAHAVLAAYRDVFAPLFWYLVLPGAVGPVLYLFARFAACHSHPFARSAYYWLDWIPLRLASLGLALAGQFEDAVFCLRAVGSIRTESTPRADPYLHQRLLLLPVAGGALGLRLADAGVDAQLRVHAPDLDLPAADPEPSSLRPVSGLLFRSSFVWVGLYVLVKLLD